MASSPQERNSHQGPVASLPCTVPQQNNSYHGPVASSPCTVAQQNNHYQDPVASSPWTLPQQNNSYQACTAPRQNSYQGPGTVPQQNNSYQGPGTVQHQNNSYQGPGTVQHQNNFYNNSYPGPVAVLWDIENCPVPSNVCAEDVAGNIRMALRFHPVVQGAVTLFSAYGDFNAFSRRLREGCQRTGVKLVDVPNGRKDAADKAILVDMFLFALDNRPPCSIVLISGDVDFAPALHILGQRGYTVILVIPAGVGARVSTALTNAGRYVWDWPSVARGEGFVPPADSYFTGCRVRKKVDGKVEEASVHRELAQSHYNLHTGEASNKKPRTDEQPQEQRTCFNCRKSSHPGKRCDGTDMLCFVCEQPGHKANQCAHKAAHKAKADGHDEEASVHRELAQSHYNLHTGEASDKKPRTDEQPQEQRTCFNCRKSSHPGKRCDGTDIVCFVCEQPGHKANQCAHKAAHKAKADGHDEEASVHQGLAQNLKNSHTGEASNKKPRADKQPGKQQFCFKCRKPYHQDKNCDGSDISCFSCKQPGHKAHQCALKAALKGKEEAVTASNVADEVSSLCKKQGQKSNERAHKSARKAKVKGPMTRARKAKLKGGTTASKGSHIKSNDCSHKNARKAKEKGATTASNGEDLSCFDCKEQGHKSFDCPYKQSRKATEKDETAVSNGAHIVCCACNHLGHLSFECPLKWIGKAKGIEIATAGKAPIVPKVSASAQKAPVAPTKHMVVVEQNLLEPIIRPYMVAVEPNLVEPIIRPDMVAVEPNLVEPIVRPDMVAVETNLAEPNMTNQEWPIRGEPKLAEQKMTNQERPIRVEPKLVEPSMMNEECPIRVELSMMNEECTIQVEPNMMNGERPIRIIDKENRTLRNNKVIPMVKVLWKSQNSEKEIWETESSMREKHQELFI